YPSGGAGDRRLTWYDRQGRQTGTAWIPGHYFDLALSPDGGRVSVARESGNSDIFVFDFLGDRSIRLTSSSPDNSQPVWSPDGKRIVFYSIRNGSGGLIGKSASGAGDEEPLLKFQMASGSP